MFKKLGTLKVKFSVITFFTYLLLILVILTATFVRFSRYMLSSYEKLGGEILAMAVEEIPMDSIPGFLSGDYDRAEYDGILAKLDRYPQHFREVYYLYALRINDDGRTGTVIFDAAVEHDGRQSLGDEYLLEKPLVDRMDVLRAGRHLEPFADRSQWGDLLTCSVPMIDSKGTCQGYLLVDFDLTAARRDNLRFTLGVFLLIFLLMCAIFCMGMKTVAERITKPIEKMYLCLSGFRYASDRDREENVRRLKGLNIHTNHEIQSLYEALVATTEDSYRYLHEFRTATEQLDIANEKAYFDLLTGFHSINAYEDRMAECQQRLDAGETLPIAFIMVDINDLKYINDTFGHEKGDRYIQGCCQFISDLCGRSSTFRVGGDEFVIVLEGEDYAHRKEIFDGLTARFVGSCHDESKEPWERCSASVGMSDCLPQDKNIAEVLKRADAAMYRAKADFKAENGSYR